MKQHTRQQEIATSNQAMMRKLVVVVGLMAGFGFALVPLYKKICEVTGIAQTRSADSLSAANTQVDSSRWITVEFVASNNGALSWQFEPALKTLKLHPGQLGQVTYQVFNNTGRKVVGQAVASYGPSLAGKHFKKLECFCFSTQTFLPDEKKNMPVTFVVSPELPKDIDTITLAYTFFDVTQQAAKGG